MLTLPHSFDFRGQSVAWGRMGAGEPIVFVHGTPFSSQVWRKIAPWVAARRTVYYFDLLGYGASEMGDGQDVSLGVQNQVLVALFQHWQIERPEVVAHDFGGATVLRAHYLNQLNYSRLTLIDPVALAPWGSPFVQHVRKHEAAFAGLPAYAHEGLLNAYLQGASHPGLSQKALTIHATPWKTEQGQRAFYRQIAQMDQRYTDEIESLYAPSCFPIQIIWGAEDRWIPLAIGQRLADKLTHGKLTAVPGAGHLVQEDAPEAVVAAII